MKKTDKTTQVWLTLILLTLSTYTLGYYNYSGSLVVLLLLLTAVIKGVLIIREFMELKGVSLLWKVMMYGWLVIICLAIIIAYTMSQ